MGLLRWLRSLLARDGTTLPRLPPGLPAGSPYRGGGAPDLAARVADLEARVARLEDPAGPCRPPAREHHWTSDGDLVVPFQSPDGFHRCPFCTGVDDIAPDIVHRGRGCLFKHTCRHCTGSWYEETALH
jgi:hypothetical protein